MPPNSGAKTGRGSRNRWPASCERAKRHLDDLTAVCFAWKLDGKREEFGRKCVCTLSLGRRIVVHRLQLCVPCCFAISLARMRLFL